MVLHHHFRQKPSEYNKTDKGIFISNMKDKLSSAASVLGGLKNPGAGEEERREPSIQP